MWNQNPVILVAEDDHNDVLILERTLRKVGINNAIRWVEDGEQALDYLRGNGKYHDRTAFPFPGVIFTDIKMPKCNGFEVLKWLRAHPECGVIPTIVLSASGIEADIVKAYEQGANCYLQKPNKSEDLAVLMKKLFDFWNVCKIPSLRLSVCAEPNPADKK